MENEETQMSVEGSRGRAPERADPVGSGSGVPGGPSARMTPEEIRAAAAWARARGLATLHTATRKSANASANPPRPMDASA